MRSRTARHRVATLLAAVTVVIVAVACTPSPASPDTVVDFADQHATVAAGGCTNCASISKTVQDSRGSSVPIRLDIFDSGSGYQWSVSDEFSYFGDSTPEFCTYPIVQVRARATFDGVTARMDWDGTSTNGMTPLVSVAAPWRVAAAQDPTVSVESVTVDLSAPPFCVPI